MKLKISSINRALNNTQRAYALIDRLVNAEKLAMVTGDSHGSLINQIEHELLLAQSNLLRFQEEVVGRS